MSLTDHAALLPERRDRPNAVSAIALIIAAATTGFAIHLNHGEYSTVAISLVTAALIAAIVAVIYSNRPVIGQAGRIAIYATLAAALAGELAALLLLWPVGVDQPADFYGQTYHRQLYLCQSAACGLFILLGFVNSPALRRWWFPALLLFHGLLAFWTIRSSPAPKIDVWIFQQKSAATLLEGRNPYDHRSVGFVDIYNSSRPGHQQVYGQGLLEGRHLTFGFPYPPLSLYCSTAGYLLGDVRYAQGLALILAGLFIGYCRPGRLPKLAAALLLLTPAIWFVLARAWTEPLVVMFLALAVFCACRNLRWLLPIALGLLLASKQYLVLAIPLSFLLVRDFDWRSKKSWRCWIGLLLGALAIAALVTLPLALRDIRAFIFSTIAVQMKAPYRWDALSYLVWICFHIHSKYMTWTFLWLAAVAPMMLLALFKAARSPAGFATALAAVSLVFIAFNKQAFCNYYFFVIGCFCCAIAATSVGTSHQTNVASDE
jgi:hypothetical protein